jgi:hypothetical protein
MVSASFEATLIHLFPYYSFIIIENSAFGTKCNSLAHERECNRNRDVMGPFFFLGFAYFGIKITDKTREYGCFSTTNLH